MKWFFISPFSINVLNVSILLIFMIYYLIKNGEISSVSRFLITFIAGVALVFISFFIIFSSLHPFYTSIAWWVLHLMVFGSVAMVQFAYHFPQNYHPQESRIVFIITLIAAIISYPYYIFKTLKLSPVYSFEGNLFAFFNTPEIGIIIGLEIGWVLIIFLRKAALLSKQSTAINKMTLIFISPIGLIAAVLMAYRGLLSWEIVAHILGTGFMFFVFLFIIIYINNSSEPSTFMIKLVGISLGSILVLSGFGANLTLSIKKDAYHKIRLLEIERCKRAIGKNDFFQVPNNVAYILSQSLPRDPQSYKVIFLRDKSIPRQKIKERTSRQFRMIDPLNPKTYYLCYDFFHNGKHYEVGYHYTEYREFIHQTGKLLVYLILCAVIFVIVVFPLFFRESLLRPLNALLNGVKKVNNGDLNVKVNVQVEDEIGFLSRCFNNMVKSILEAENQLRLAFQHQVRLTEAYSCFVPKEFFYFLKKENVLDIKLGDHIQREMTILFSDIRSFTKLSEKMTPEQSFDFINSYLHRVGPVIRRNKGFIDKYIGDAIMALFPENAEDAVRAAIAMQREVAVYNRHQKNCRHRIGIVKTGVGIHIGELMLGTIGEEKRMEGTVISDAVNLASRMEGLTKLYGASIVVSSKALENIKDHRQFNYRFLDRVQVKGKEDWVDVFDLFDADDQYLLALKQQTKGCFENGVFLYRQKQIADAMQCFRKVKEKNRDDMAAQLYIHRCENLQKYGIPEQWEGITVLD